MFRKILIAVNDDAFALKPAEVGFRLARRLEAETAVVFVIDQRLAVSNMDTGIAPLDAMEILRREAVGTLDELVGKFGGEQPVQRFTPEGRPTDEILRTARDWNAELIVLGTHGRSGLLQLISGSITAYLKHHSEIPVLIVPSHEPGAGEDD